METPADFADTLKFIADDHPCCATALAPIIRYLESQSRTRYFATHCGDFEWRVRPDGSSECRYPRSEWVSSGRTLTGLLNDSDITETTQTP